MNTHHVTMIKLEFTCLYENGQKDITTECVLNLTTSLKIETSKNNKKYTTNTKENTNTLSTIN